MSLSTLISTVIDINLGEALTTMDRYLDRLFRLMDLVDLRVYKRLVITSSLDYFNASREVFRGRDTLHIALTSGTTGGDGIVSLPTPDLDGLWTSVSHDVIDRLLGSIEPYVTSDIFEVIVAIGTRPADLCLAYKVLANIRRICGRCRVITILHLPPRLGDVDGVNALSFITLIHRHKLSDLVLLTSSKLTDYLKLVRYPNPLAVCLDVLLRYYGRIYEYLGRFGRTGMLACLPGIDMDLFGDLANAVKFVHHLVGDYHCDVRRLLVITSYGATSLGRETRDSAVASGVELEVAAPKALDTDYLAIVEPNGYLIRLLYRYVSKAYEVVKVLDPSVSIDDLLGMVELG